MSLDDLKKKRNITRTDIAELLASLGEPGQNREEKLAALKSLNRQNRQGHDLSVTAESYREY
jgi:hypothetical protein